MLPPPLLPSVAANPNPLSHRRRPAPLTFWQPPRLPPLLPALCHSLSASSRMEPLTQTYATGTSAAPSYLPALQFTNKDPKGNVHEFNLIDGGICANNSKFNATSCYGIEGGGLSFFSDIALLLIDEVHLLNDPRGAALEAIVSIIKIVSCNPKMKLNHLDQVRLVAVSATIPNIEDLAEWIKVLEEGFKRFGEEMRPVKLTTKVFEHLLVEIVQLTVTDITKAIKWLQCSYLYVRMKKNPENYSIKKGISGDRLVKHVQDICVKKVNELSQHQMVEIDEDGFLLSPLDPGRLMTKYYLRFDTMKQIMRTPENCCLEDALHVICSAEEIACADILINYFSV
ncbi:uncharacterized protein DS421_18g627430 [Arachis hypogaea]|nr:uncharacterized protein DS421_18g627430 [Arachis hypogaea]